MSYFFDLVVVAIVIACIAFGGRRIVFESRSARTVKASIKLKTIDEIGTVIEAVVWAIKTLPPGDIRRKRMAILRGLLMGSWIPSFTRITHDDLVILAPFIEEIIAGRGPPPLGPDPDIKPAVMQGFKDRLVREGGWPQETEALRKLDLQSTEIR